MNALLDAAQEVADFFTNQGWEYCVIGGLAVQKWGEPRTTFDADILLMTGWGEELPYVTAILERFESRIVDGRDFALTRRVLLIKATNAVDVDIALGALPFEVEMVRRAVAVEFVPQCVLRCCTAEDLFIMKAFAGRPRDWLDVEGLAARKRDLDKEYIRRHLGDLAELKDDAECMKRANRLLMDTQ